MTAAVPSPPTSSCHSSLPERGGRASVNANSKADFSRASLTSLASFSAKRKRLSLTTTVPSAAQNMINGRTMFDSDLTPPRRRFKRRNSKCASMFYQMISPTTLLELQRIAGDTQEEPRNETMTVLPSLHHDNNTTQTRQGMVEGEEDEEGSRWSCTQLRSQVPATPRPLCNSPCTVFPVSMKKTLGSPSTHSILAEALRLSSALLDHKNSGEDTLADDDESM